MFRSHHRWVLILAIFLAACATAPVLLAQDSDNGSGCSAYAAVPLPAEAASVATPKTAPACASYRSYRGIGRPVDYAAARACAWRERLAQKAGLGQNPQEPDAWVVGGSLILADIYFNGSGVKRNVPLAMRFACEAEQAMVELAQPDLAKLNGALPAHGPFEFCDYAATTFTMDFCGGYEAEVAADHKAREYASMKASMTLEQGAAFDKLLAAQKEYVDAHVSEVDQQGTIRALRTLDSQDILNNLFQTDVVHFERKQFPALSADEIKTADASLARQYAKSLAAIKKQPQDEIDEGAVTADGLAKAQKAWLTYRDAWTNFARLRYPANADAIRAQITLERTRLVKTSP